MIFTFDLRPHLDELLKGFNLQGEWEDANADVDVDVQTHTEKSLSQSTRMKDGTTGATLNLRRIDDDETLTISDRDGNEVFNAALSDDTIDKIPQEYRDAFKELMKVRDQTAK